MARRRPGRSLRASGMTLVEVLVALSIMAVLALMSWRGLDAMVRTQSTTVNVNEDVLALQGGIEQWTLDLDMLAQTPWTSPLAWEDGSIRMTRRSALDSESLRLVVWTMQAEGSGQRWVRWQSGEIRSKQDFTAASQQASGWLQGKAGEAAQAVRIVSVSGFQVLFHSAGRWQPAPRPQPNRAAVEGIAADLPDGVRLMLELPPQGTFSGGLNVDWANPAATGGRS
ncbi:MAG: prepilin-type N-terminal cleavage/methylation domain-containing protein [Pseudomonadota bacterium]